MKNSILVLLSLILISSCAKKRDGEAQNTLSSKIIEVTDNEYKGVADVLNSYGGECNRQIGFEMKNGNKQTYFELEMMRSRTLEEYAPIIELPASNIAYIFYKRLNELEKKKYSYIRVTIDLKSGSKKTYNYPLEKLELLSEKVNVIIQTSNLIGKEDYKRLFELIDKSAAPGLTVEQIANLCKQVDSKYGKVDSVQFEGFSFFNTPQKQNKEFLHLAAMQYRKGQKNPLSIFIDPNITNIENSINTLKFKF